MTQCYDIEKPDLDRFLKVDDELAQALAPQLIEACINYRVDFLGAADGWKFSFNKEDLRAVGVALSACELD